MTIVTAASASAGLAEPYFTEHQVDHKFEHRPQLILMEDLTNDGWLDLIVSEPGLRTIWMWNPRRGSECIIDDDTYPSAMTVADMDQDGDGDLITNDYSERTVRVYCYEGGSRCPDHRVRTFSTDLAPAALAAGDLNNDGWPDLVVGHNSHSLVVYLSLGADNAGHWRGLSEAIYIKEPSTYPFPNHIVLDDANSDGLIDVIVATGGFAHSGGVHLFLNGGVKYDEARHQGEWMGGSEEIRIFHDGRGPSSLRVADLNNDGLNDLVFTYIESTYGRDNLFIAQGIEPGLFAIPQGQRIPDDARASTIGDFDGDHDIDIVTGHYAYPSLDSYLMFYENDGDANFTEPGYHRIEVSGLAPVYLAAGDIDRDRDADLAVTFNVSGGASVFESINGLIARPER